MIFIKAHCKTIPLQQASNQRIRLKFSGGGTQLPFLNKRLKKPFFSSFSSGTYIAHFFPLWQPKYGHSGDLLSSSYVRFPVLQCGHSFRLNIFFYHSRYFSLFIRPAHIRQNAIKVTSPPNIAPPKNINISFILVSAPFTKASGALLLPTTYDVFTYSPPI